MPNNLSLKVVPTTKNFQILEINIKGNGQIEPEDLKKIRLPKTINYTKGVVISGKAPVWLFSFLSHELHIAKWVATFDPRIGAVVVQSHDKHSPQKGDTIKAGYINQFFAKKVNNSKRKIPRKKKNPKVICIVGPANSGKSVFIRELRKVLNKIFKNQFRRDYFIIRACPDGEGDWFGDIDTNEGKIYRQKKTFDDAFISKIVDDLKVIKQNKKVILVDCGGKIDRKNQIIFNESTHAIVVSNDKEKAKEWFGALKASELEVTATIYSSKKSMTKKVGKNEFEIGKLYREENRVKLHPDLIKLISEK